MFSDFNVTVIVIEYNYYTLITIGGRQIGQVGRKKVEKLAGVLKLI